MTPTTIQTTVKLKSQCNAIVLDFHGIPPDSLNAITPNTRNNVPTA
ncbi:unnamed protein product [Schistosoma margrebowiei]|uniref:Uncharacterized protein n=1 Tax=Schistosoma margrebowiei TaxID=48269 RepID=A0A183MIJ9_9TREM|nr:unnamed protein product [Schistosoma margrebowiei]